MAAPDFLTDLNNSMARLATVNGNVQTHLQHRTDFQGQLLVKLKDISQRIRDITGNVDALKADVDRMQQQISSHGQSIDGNNAQIADLQAQIQR